MTSEVLPDVAPHLSFYPHLPCSTSLPASVSVAFLNIPVPLLFPMPGTIGHRFTPFLFPSIHTNIVFKVRSCSWPLHLSSHLFVFYLSIQLLPFSTRLWATGGQKFCYLFTEGIGVEWKTSFTLPNVPPFKQLPVIPKDLANPVTEFLLGPFN